MQHRAGWAAIAVAAGLAAGCVPAPRQNYSLEEIPRITELKELMRVMYAGLKTTWPLADRSSLGPADFGTAASAATQVEAVSATVQDRFAPDRPEAFGDFARQLHAQAEDLAQGAAARDAAAVRDAVTRLGQTCESCHHAYR